MTIYTSFKKRVRHMSRGLATFTSVNLKIQASIVKYLEQV
ncbi:hypothetical protein RintRC_4073 [Richelia intracellularis]|nr:hypothetical protein RintRC_4073 [Richelia intracellularis]